MKKKLLKKIISMGAISFTLAPMFVIASCKSNKQKDVIDPTPSKDGFTVKTIEYVLDEKGTVTFEVECQDKSHSHSFTNVQLKFGNKVLSKISHEQKLVNGVCSLTFENVEFPTTSESIYVSISFILDKSTTTEIIDNITLSRCPNPDPEEPEEDTKFVYFESSQAIQNVTFDESGTVSVKIIGACSTGLSPHDLDKDVKCEVISCSGGNEPNLSASIIERGDTTVTIEVTCSNVKSVCNIYYNLFFEYSDSQETVPLEIEADTSFLISVVGREEQISYHSEEKEFGVDVVKGFEKSIDIESFSVNGNMSGIYVSELVFPEGAEEWVNKLVAKIIPNSDGTFKIQIVFSNSIDVSEGEHTISNIGIKLRDVNNFE